MLVVFLQSYLDKIRKEAAAQRRFMRENSIFNNQNQSSGQHFSEAGDYSIIWRK
jgi:hypothetical protein